MKKSSILLIDANALIHRAFHALPLLTNKEGEIINAVYGFSMILLKAIGDLKPKYIAIAFDTPKPTFRHKKFKEYKATRQKAPEELIEQFPKIKELVDALSFPYFEKAGYEADDIVGALAKQANAKNVDAIIVTGDKDEIQLVNKNTKVYTMKRGFTDTVIYDEKMVKEKYDGLSPKQLIDYKALKGDPSDNIPGVPGVGEKTAINLIKNFKNVENLYKEISDNIEKTKNKIKPKVLESLRKNEKEVERNKDLVTIRKDIPIKLDLEKSKTKNYNRAKVIRVFKKYQFKTLLSKLPKSENNTDERSTNNLEYIITKKEGELKKALREISKKDECVVDTETETLDEITGTLIGISLSNNREKGFYIPISSRKDPLLKPLKKFLEDKRIKKIGHNIKYDINVLKNYNINIGPIYYDTMIAYYLLNPGERRFSLKDLAFSELEHEMIPIEDLIGKKGKNQKIMSEVKLEKIAEYSAEDAVITYRLYKKSQNKLTNKIKDLFNEIEMPIVETLATMEKEGISINEKVLKKISKDSSAEIKNLEKKIYKLAECNFNINSPQQLKEILYKKLKLREKMEYPQNLKKLKSGGYSTAANTLEKLKNTHPIINYISRYRELSKLKSTYADALPRLVNKKTKRIHTSFNQTVTATGRLSSSNPNLQNIPIKTKTGRRIRKAFIAKRGFNLISADYSQIELRIIAHLSKDRTMVTSFKNHEDIHSRTAAEVNEVPLSQVTYEMRSAAKATNFGIVYGIGAHGLANQLGWTNIAAKNYIEKYYRKHSELINFLDKTIKETKIKGYAETLLGRKRYIPEINSPNFQVRASGERMAINFPAQGTAADFIKIAMVKINNELPRISPKSKMLLQVHDELVLETPIKEVGTVANFLEKTMEKVYPSLAVPIQVDISYGNNWKDMKEIIRGDKNKTKEFNH